MQSPEEFMDQLNKKIAETVQQAASLAFKQGLEEGLKCSNYSNEQTRLAFIGKVAKAFVEIARTVVEAKRKNDNDGLEAALTVLKNTVRDFDEVMEFLNKTTETKEG